MQSSENTEKKILQAAREEFIQTGFNGARMQAIAERAGVNKALLHYYFRSKDKLYKAALLDIMNTFWTTVEQEITTRSEITSFESAIRLMVETHFKVMGANPYFPRMLMREVIDGGNMIPLMAKEVVTRYGHIPAMLMKLFQREFSSAKAPPMKPVHLILNIMGMCIITFVTRPLVEPISNVFGTSLKFDEEFLKDRVDSIISIVKNGIFPKDSK